MYVNNSHFTEEDYIKLKNNFRKIGEIHGVSGQYVGAIASGIRAIKSEKSKEVFCSLQKLLRSIKAL